MIYQCLSNIYIVVTSYVTKEVKKDGKKLITISWWKV